MCKLKLPLCLAVRSKHVSCCCGFSLLVLQEESCNECHGCNENKSKYNTNCDNILGLHYGFGGRCTLYKMSLVVSRPLDPGHSDRRVVLSPNRIAGKLQLIPGMRFRTTWLPLPSSRRSLTVRSHPSARIRLSCGSHHLSEMWSERGSHHLPKTTG